MNGPFQYAPLDLAPTHDGSLHFRVLEVHPASSMTDHIISCTLLESSLRPLSMEDSLEDSLKPQHLYHTISYAWGDASIKSRARVNGQLLEIGRNSEQALKSIQLKHYSRIVWIDAICIDQTNLDEKAHQVAAMADLYRHGERNLVYLGDDNGSVASALSGIESLLATKIKSADFLRRRPDNIYDDGLLHPNTQDIRPVEPALAMFFSYPWFKRLWVHQEVALASHSTCLVGRFVVSLIDVLIVARWLYARCRVLRQDRWDMQALQCASAMFESMQEKFSTRTSLSIWNNSRNFECSDGRDKIYGTLGLIGFNRKALPPELTPNYTLTIAEVLTKAMVWMMRGNLLGLQTRDVLSQISHRSQEDIHVEGLASWVPRWFRPWQAALDAWPLRTPYYHILDGNRRIDFSVLHDGRCLVEGVLLGAIGEIVSSPAIFDWASFGTHYLATLRSLKSHDYAECLVYEVLTADPHPEDADPDEYLDFNSWVTRLECSMDPRTEAIETSPRWATAVHNACSHRSIGVTDTGIPALFPSASLRGDHIVWICGAEHPSILRLQGDDFEVIGQAFLSGMAEMYEDIAESSWKDAKLYSLI